MQCVKALQRSPPVESRKLKLLHLSETLDSITKIIKLFNPFDFPSVMQNLHLQLSKQRFCHGHLPNLHNTRSQQNTRASLQDKARELRVHDKLCCCETTVLTTVSKMERFKIIQNLKLKLSATCSTWGNSLYETACNTGKDILIRTRD